MLHILEPQFIGSLFVAVAILSFSVLLMLRYRNLFAILLLGFSIVAIFIVILNYFINFIPQPRDAIERFIPWAMATVDNWKKGFVLQTLSLLDAKGIPAYTLFLAIFFYFFDQSIIIASLFSTIFGLLCIYQLYQLSRELYDNQTANLSAALLVFSPFFIYVSTVILRETITLFFLLWFFRLWFLNMRQPANKYRSLMLFSLVYMGLLRPLMLLVLIISITIDKTILTSKRNIVFKMTMIGLVILIFLSGIIFLESNPSLINYRIFKGLAYTKIEKIQDRMEASADAQSSYVPNVNFNSYNDIIKNMPILVIYFLGSPFPWQVKKLNQALALIDSAMLWFMYIIFYIEIKNIIKTKNKKISLLLIYLLIGICGSAVIQGNMAAAQRHRLIFTILILPFVAHRIKIWLKIKRTVKNQVRYKKITAVNNNNVSPV